MSKQNVSTNQLQHEFDVVSQAILADAASKALITRVSDLQQDLSANALELVELEREIERDHLLQRYYELKDQLRKVLPNSKECGTCHCEHSCCQN